MSTTESCGLSDHTLRGQEIAYFATYFVIMPIYFIVGLSGNIALLAAFYKQSKSNSAYAYQIFFTCSKTLEIFFSTLFWWGYKWNAGVERPGHVWYMNNLVLMFYSAHIGAPLANGFIVASLLFSVAMTADRVFASWKPFAYKFINHRRHQLIAIVCCLFLGFSTSAFEVKRWRVVYTGSSANASSEYEVEYDEEYLNQPAAMTLGHMRTGVRLVALVILIISNIAMVTILRKHFRKTDRIGVIGDRKDKERRISEKDLLLLTACQSALMALGHIPHSGYFIAAFISSSFSRCSGVLVASIADGFIQVTSAAEFFVIISMNKKIRKTIQVLILHVLRKRQSSP